MPTMTYSDLQVKTRNAWSIATINAREKLKAKPDTNISESIKLLVLVTEAEN